jgi:prepilin-type N-terminal cleavage/methylation domain-containing protein/prepilin-type processing-associated H-X9-DG protein
MIPQRRAFTLIEVLVVVAIIALLVAVLLPSLARAKAMARMTQCQSNQRQIAMAFQAYSTETKGRLPGGFYDRYADWFGAANKPGYTGRQPDDGVIWKHMGRQRQAYVCPADVLENHEFSYSANIILSGAKTEMLASAHYPLDNFNTTNHGSSSQRMKAFDGVPLIVEEDSVFYLITNDEGGWANDDRLTERHLPIGGRGFGNIGFTDGHVGKLQLWPGGVGTPADKYFCANNQCVHTSGRKWVTGWSWLESSYGYMDRASPAEKPPPNVNRPAIIH